MAILFMLMVGLPEGIIVYPHGALPSCEKTGRTRDTKRGISGRTLR